MATQAYSLKDVQSILDTPPHVLIHLCEKEVVIPDVYNAKGRGTSRLFSKRNLLDFGIALSLRKFDVSATAMRGITVTVRAFEGWVQDEIDSDFSLPDALLVPRCPLVTYHVFDDGNAYFQINKSRKNTFLILNVDRYLEGKLGLPLIGKVKKLPEKFGAWLSLSLNQLAERHIPTSD